MHGFGVYYFKETDGRYIGFWENSKRHGAGEMKVEGSTHRGEYRNGMKHGFGTCWYPLGTTYIGEFKFDCAEGFGVYTFADGTRYEGNFEKNLPSGRGRKITGERSVYGNWKDGELQKEINPFQQGSNGCCFMCSAERLG